MNLLRHCLPCIVALLTAMPLVAATSARQTEQQLQTIRERIEKLTSELGRDAAQSDRLTRNLRDAEFMSRITRQHFVNVVREGLPNTSMPAWKNVLSATEIEAVAAYVNRAFHPLRTIAAEPADAAR